MLAEFDEIRLHAAAKLRPAAATGQLAVIEDECRDVLWATLAPASPRTRLVRRMIRGLARPTADFRTRHGLDPGMPDRPARAEEAGGTR
jgi:hypothetical protein